jgi:2-methylisocitrate lyase-like PEP mutase family enzyme
MPGTYSARCHSRKPDSKQSVQPFWGVAKSLGFPDGEMIEFTTDIESGYGEDEQTIVDNVLKLAGSGASGTNH